MSAILALAFGLASCKSNVDDDPTMYTVTVSSSIEHGKVSVDKTSAEAGATIKLTATADSGYELESYSVKDASENELTVTDGTFTMPESNVTVSATFKEKSSSGGTTDSGTTSGGTGTGGTTTTGGGDTPATAYIGTKAPSEAKSVGDIVFSDGSATAYTSGLTLTDEQKSKAVAVIFYVGSASDTLGAKTLGVGLENTGTDNTLLWAKNDVNGYSTNITAIQCTPVGDEAATATFSGDLDGSDNWQALCDAVSDEGTSGNYPAWEWVNAYATTTNLTGDYASGWYLPTVAELSMLYTAKGTVNSALEKAGGTKIADTAYWSSSQGASNDNSAWVVWFHDGYLSTEYKDASYSVSVCTVRAF